VGIALAPPRRPLEWLIQNAELVDQSAHAKASRATRAKRERLLRRDPATIEEALHRLSLDRGLARGWYVLEGATRPDVYLESDRALVVIEGKRTETAATSSTTWNPAPSVRGPREPGQCQLPPGFVLTSARRAHTMRPHRSTRRGGCDRRELIPPVVPIIDACAFRGSPESCTLESLEGR
jgi:hypothetical protein